MKRVVGLIVPLFFCYYSSAFSTIINIPNDYPTIQAGVDATANGDTVLVADGIYSGDGNFRITFRGRAVSLLSQNGPEQTTIDCNWEGPAFLFMTGEDSTAVVNGITITHGYAEFTFNLRANGGGGILCINGSSPRIVNCRITDNYANSFSVDDGSIPGYGGGLACIDASPIIERSVFYGNWAENGWSSNGRIIYSSGGAIFASGSQVRVINCVLTDNSAGNGSGIAFGTAGNPEVKNTIIWNNFPEEIAGNIDIRYSDIRGGYLGIGNIDTDPLFRDPDNGDFHLMSIPCGNPENSPCIDTGHPGILDSLLDCSRGLGTVASDMGAYGGGDSVLVGVIDDFSAIPDIFDLIHNYPNPFNASTTISFSLPRTSDVTISIYNLLGQQIATILKDRLPAGGHKAVWNAVDFSSGVYFALLEANDKSENIKMILLK